MNRLASFASALAVLGLAVPAAASCEASFDFWHQANACRVVFAGHVMKVSGAPGGGEIVVEVDQVLQSMVPRRRLVMATPWGPSDIRVDDRYLFVLVTLPDSDTYTTDTGECEQPAILRIDSRHTIDWFRTELRQRNKAALSAASASCTTGDRDGCFQLGCMFQEGIGVPRNRSRAAQYFRRAAELTCE